MQEYIEIINKFGNKCKCKKEDLEGFLVGGARLVDDGAVDVESKPKEVKKEVKK